MNVEDLDTPALIVDLDRLERNIARMAVLVREGGKRLRPHAKTHKTPQVARLQMAAGACGLTVAKLGEAEAMADAGLDDLFIANQVVGAPKIERLLALLRRVRVGVAVDSLANAAPLSEAAERAGLRVPVRIEVDTGLHRAGARTVQEAVALGVMVAGMPGLEMAGIFTHEGHAYKTDASERAAACAAAADMMRHVAAGLRASGVAVPEVSVGSTPGAPHMAGEAGVTEMRPGVYVFNDVTQTTMGATGEDCALTVLATVVSRPDATTAVLDAGTKALSGDRAPEGSRHGRLLEDPAVIFDRASEEHGVLDLSAAALRPKVGEKVRVIPWHACPCANLHETLYAVRGEKVEDEWPITARGKIR